MFLDIREPVFLLFLPFPGILQIPPEDAFLLLQLFKSRTMGGALLLHHRQSGFQMRVCLFTGNDLLLQYIDLPRQLLTAHRVVLQPFPDLVDLFIQLRKLRLDPVIFISRVLILCTGFRELFFRG